MLSGPAKKEEKRKLLKISELRGLIPARMKT